MKTVVIGAATSSTFPLLRRLGGLLVALCCRREALKHRLQEFALELLAVIVLLAIFIAATEPATREDY